MKLNGLEKYFKTVNGEIVDFKQVNEKSYSPLMFVLIKNKTANLNLSNEQFDYLIKKSNLKQYTDHNVSILMLAFRNNYEQNLNLTNDVFKYLIKNTNLKKKTKCNDSVLNFALMYNKEQYLNLNIENWKYLIHNSNLSLVKNKEEILTLKKIQSELLNDEILSKIDIKENTYKNNKI